ncbi:MAG: CGNR zinc finger domain-containing protein [Streptosporangiaceae bacterium]
MLQPGDRAPAPGQVVLVQDYVNTVDLEMNRDAFTRLSGLIAFCKAAAIPASRISGRDLDRAIQLREALRDVCETHAGHPAPAASLRLLDAALRDAPIILRLDASGQAGLVPATGLPGMEALTAHLAIAINAGTADGSWPRLKACSADTCRWVYYDGSPSGRSRWCTMSICGSRAKVRAYRERRTCTRTGR